MTLTKIAIVGSCITRDNFNTLFNPTYKEDFECVLHQHQCSMLSLMSPVLSIPEDVAMDQMNAFTSWHYRTEHTKEFLSQLHARQPEYLLLDLYADIYLGVVETANGYFTYNPKFAAFPPVSNQEGRFTLDGEFERYLAVWKEHVGRFFEHVQQVAPSCQVILVKARFVDVFADGSSLNAWRESRKYPTVDTELLNALWNELDSYIEESFPVRVLDMSKDAYTLNAEHPWGSFYVHYTADFYHDFLARLITLTK
ncbi:hypothetical protein HB902_14025 [Listeria booriae]|uniref:Uncharacterized protein n=1 Tax=Listeria booriae TaxID=1552123 RepID=A0A7X0XLZ4_9LIST|nr:hypothetical protein [Listeria booriae]